MTILPKPALHALLALLLGSLLSGCLPIGFRGSSLYVAATPAPARP
ncbi:MAG: hypothetical protein ABIO63_00175 [Casimicrobiaceae bacterium]